MANDQEMRFIIRAIKEGKGIEEIVSGLSDITKKGKEVNPVMAQMKGAFSALLPALSATAVVSSMKSMSDQAFQYADAVDKVTDITGVSAEQASKWVLQAQHVGTSSETVANGMAILSKNLYSNVDAFSKFGIEVKNANGSMKPLDEIIAQVRDKEKQMGEGAKTTAMEMSLFGRSGKELHDFLSADNEEMEKVSQAGERLGLVLDKTSKDSFEQMKRKMNDFKMVQESVGLKLATNLIPVLLALEGVLIRATEGWGRLFDAMTGASKAKIQATADVTNAYANAIEDLNKQLKAGTITQEKYKTTLETFKKIYNDTSDNTKKAGDSVDDFGDKAEKAGTKAKESGTKASKAGKDVKGSWKDTADSVGEIFDQPFNALEKKAKETATNVGASFAKTFVGDAAKDVSAMTGAIGAVFGFIGGTVVAGFLSLFTNQKSYAEVVEERFKQMSENANKAISEIGKEKTLAQKRLDVFGALSVGAGGTYGQGQVSGELGIIGMTEAEAKKKLLNELLIQQQKELDARKKTVPEIEEENKARQLKIETLRAEAVLPWTSQSKQLALLGQIISIQADIDAAKKVLDNYDKVSEYDVLKAILETRTALGIPAFATGGTVPGPIGAPVIATVHGGEVITPPGKTVGGSTTININVGAFMGTEADAMAFAKTISKYQNKITRRNLTV